MYGHFSSSTTNAWNVKQITFFLGFCGFHTGILCTFGCRGLAAPFVEAVQAFNVYCSRHLQGHAWKKFAQYAYVVRNHKLRRKSNRVFFFRRRIGRKYALFYAVHPRFTSLSRLSRQFAHSTFQRSDTKIVLREGNLKSGLPRFWLQKYTITEGKDNNVDLQENYVFSTTKGIWATNIISPHIFLWICHGTKGQRGPISWTSR